MLCEKCAKEIETVTCSGCGETVAKLGAYCYRCGHEIAGPSALTEAGQTGADRDEAGEIDLSTRILCSDGTCIGVINEKGVCKVCGKPYSPES
jgi:predicted amidophosphoribosyltransferase